MITKTETVCKTCGKKFLVYPSQIRQGQGKYCSIECRVQDRSNSQTISCQTCGKKFLVYQCLIRAGKGKYCSRVCRDKRKTTKVEVICQVCNKKFLVYPSRTRNGNVKYCSNKCRGKSQTMQIETTCQICKKRFMAGQSQIRVGGGKYCSKECRSKGIIKEVKITCPTCSKEFITAPGKIRKGEGKYCSKKCQGVAHRGSNSPVWQGGVVGYRGYNWEEQRQKALARDDNTCQACGVKMKLDVHHVIPCRLFAGNFGRANELENLVTLCRTCHNRVNFEAIHKWNMFALLTLMLIGSFSEKEA